MILHLAAGGKNKHFCKSKDFCKEFAPTVHLFVQDLILGNPVGGESKNHSLNSIIEDNNIYYIAK